MWEMVLAGLFAPPILFFVLGMVSVFVKSDLHIPPAMGTAMVIFLMASIGITGGAAAIESLKADPALIGVIVAIALLAMFLGPFFAFATGSLFKKFMRTADAWACAGHYGAVSSATVALGVSLAGEAQAANPAVQIFAGWMPAVYPFMDSSALIAAIVLGRMALIKEQGAGEKADVRKVLQLTVFGMGVWILVTSLVIGMVSAVYSPGELSRALLFFDDMFRGIICLFMLEMGLAAAKQIGALKELGKHAVKALFYAFALPQVWGIIGILGAYAIHLAMPGKLFWGDAFVFATLAGGCSFVTAPAAMRANMPEANPSVYLPMAVALTFPFNVLIGMPMWMIVSQILWGAA
jgi:hypothetical protein